MLTIKEHLEVQKGEFGPLAASLLVEFNSRFDHIINPMNVKFTVLYLALAMLNPQSTTELTDNLFEEGKGRLIGFLKSERAQFKRLQKGIIFVYTC